MIRMSAAGEAIPTCQRAISRGIALFLCSQIQERPLAPIVVLNRIGMPGQHMIRFIHGIDDFSAIAQRNHPDVNSPYCTMPYAMIIPHSPQHPQFTPRPRINLEIQTIEQSTTAIRRLYAKPNLACIFKGVSPPNPRTAPRPARRLPRPRPPTAGRGRQCSRGMHPSREAKEQQLHTIPTTYAKPSVRKVGVLLFSRHRGQMDNRLDDDNGLRGDCQAAFKDLLIGVHTPRLRFARNLQRPLEP